MKLVATLVALLTAATLQATDIRTISGIKVDLQPIHDWSASTKTNSRPMAHWKYVTLSAVVKSYGTTMFQVEATVEGERQSIILKHPPEDLYKKLVKRNELLQREQRGSNYTANAVRNAQVAESQASITWVVVGDSSYVNAVAADEANKKRIAANSAAHAGKAIDDLEALRSEISTLTKEINETTFLAMSMNSEYAGKPVWDTGLK